ncbi:hypothetical protein CFC21_026620 [Triticum aestivum]|uniref:Uncharacterized protein n=2 Tax=Triticum aestivum TaxID=4565 RepID=A0A3B6CGS3_WHEAT|nr:hypothetical protein CFC21_026620 [Triticum aestivum]
MATLFRERCLCQKFSEQCLPESQDTCYPEEQYLRTPHDVADPAGCTWYTLTRINYTDSVDGDPRTYGVPEVSLLLTAELRQSNNSTYEHMFVRKVAPDCLGPLMVIADTVIFKD